MHLEIERKFLVKGEYKSQATSVIHIEQGYLCSVSARTVRVRIIGEKGFITVKGESPDGGISRFEWEKEISATEAKALLALCEPGRINKNRYLIPVGNHICEVDEFFDENAGLVLAEIELKRADEAFEKPDWLGIEVTGDLRYYNAMLVKQPYTSW
ncbi:MAG: CYTH domain-containing protein [Bacteroidales bacterium]|nr:CYTH domain-containing protein [Bacteroidales bacterium]